MAQISQIDYKIIFQIFIVVIFMYNIVSFKFPDFSAVNMEIHSM